MSEALELKFAETLARDALAHEFDRLGLAFSTLHPTIRAVMERAVVSSGNVGQQVERFLLVARMADQHDLPDADKRYVFQNTGLI